MLQTKKQPNNQPYSSTPSLTKNSNAIVNSYLETPIFNTQKQNAPIQYAQIQNKMGLEHRSLSKNFDHLNINHASKYKSNHVNNRISSLNNKAKTQSIHLSINNSKTLSIHLNNNQNGSNPLNQINSYAQQANNNKILQENMLNKLLRPPIKKQFKSQLRKYDPQFPKPDVEKLIHENNILKQQIQQSTKTIMELKFKIKEQQKKLQKLEINNTQQLQQILERKKKNTSIHTQILKKKIHQLHTKFINAESQIKRLKKLPNSSIYQENNIQKQHLLAETIRLKSILTSYYVENDQIAQAQENDGTNGDSQIMGKNNSSTGMQVPHFSLNKCQDPNMSNIGQSSQQINTAISNAIISPSMNNKKFQQQFLRMLKQQNQKLKATIRLLENDKILMKSRQTTQNKQTSDIKKQLDTIRNKLVLKQAEIEKLIHENQNLLFKRAAKYRIEKEQKQNKIISELNKSIQELRQQNRRIQEQKLQLIEDNKNIKLKEEKKNNELNERDKQFEKIKVQLVQQIRNEYEARIKSLQMNKLHHYNSLNTNHNNDSNLNINLNGYNNGSGKNIYFNPNETFRSNKNININKMLSNNFIKNPSNLVVDSFDLLINDNKDKIKANNGRINWGKAVKFQELDCCILKLWALKQEQVVEAYEELFQSYLSGDMAYPNMRHKMSRTNKTISNNNVNRMNLSLNKNMTNSINLNIGNAIISFEQLYYLFKYKPINFTNAQSIKMCKYIFSDHYQSIQQPYESINTNCIKKQEKDKENKQSQQTDRNRRNMPVIEVSLAVTIIKASINQFIQCLTNINVINSWKCVVSKSKKFVKQLEELPRNIISKQQFLEKLVKNRTSCISFQQINFMLLHGYSLQIQKTGSTQNSEHTTQKQRYTQQDILLDRKMILESIYGLMGDPKYLTSIFSRSNIGFPNFDVLVSGGLSDQVSHKMQKSLRRTSIAKNNKIFDNDEENYKQEYPYHHSISKNSQKSKLSIKDEEMAKEKQKQEQKWNSKKSKAIYNVTANTYKELNEYSSLDKPKQGNLHIKKINTQSDEDIGTKMTKVDIYRHIDKMNINKNGNNDIGQNKKSILKKTNTLKNENNTDLAYSDHKIGDVLSRYTSSTKQVNGGRNTNNLSREKIGKDRTINQKIKLGRFYEKKGQETKSGSQQKLIYQIGDNQGYQFMEDDEDVHDGVQQQNQYRMKYGQFFSRQCRKQEEQAEEYDSQVQQDMSDDQQPQHQEEESQCQLQCQQQSQQQQQQFQQQQEQKSDDNRENKSSDYFGINRMNQEQLYQLQGRKSQNQNTKTGDGEHKRSFNMENI